MNQCLWFDRSPFGYKRRWRKQFYMDSKKREAEESSSSSSFQLPPPLPRGSDRKVTDTGIDLLNPPELYCDSTANQKGDSTTATVISMATGYGMEVSTFCWKFTKK